MVDAFLGKKASIPPPPGRLPTGNRRASNREKRPRDDLSFRLETVETVRPIGHHPDALGAMLAANIGTAHVIVFDMPELPLDGVGVPRRIR